MLVFERPPLKRKDPCINMTDWAVFELQIFSARSDCFSNCARYYYLVLYQAF